MLAFLLLASSAAALVVLQATSQGANQADPAPESVETRVRVASLFKNGFAFVRREGPIPGGISGAIVDELPNPVHGTFWVIVDAAGLELESAVARRSETRDVAQAVNVPELLRANVGRELTLFFGDNESLTGTLLSMPESRPRRDEVAPGHLPIPSPGNLLILELATGAVAMAPGEVKRVSAADGLELEFERTREAARLELRLRPTSGADPATEAAGKLALMYAERGLTWVPSYAIDISEPGAARLTAKAEVINEAEDLDGAQLQFVTGFPNLQFSHVVDPIALQGNLDAFLGALGQGVAGTPVVARQMVTSNRAMFAESASFPTAGDPNAGTQVEDLFFYEQSDVDLKRGERGLYQLFTISVPYEHLYEWSVAESLQRQNHRGAASPTEEVWHSVRLTNDSRVPWTTAPAMTMKAGNLLGQDTLSYASVGAKTTVRITQAVDVQGEAAEFETGRDRGAANMYGRSYDRVTVNGELRVVNHKSEAIQLEIKKSFEGALAKNPDEADAVTVAEGLQQINPTTRLTWSVPLEAGATRKIEYVYTLLVRP